jgi:hypothetical protein
MRGSTDRELEQRARDLRRRIARLRRRIDGRIRAAQTEARRLTSWRTYLRHFPGQAMMGAFGIGLALSAGLGARRWARWLGIWLVRRAADQAGQRLWQELARLWAESAPERQTAARGASDERT